MLYGDEQNMLEQLNRIEEKLDRLLQAMDQQQPAQQSANNEQIELERECRALLAQNKKIHAIKLYRERTGLGLKDAKEAVEALQSNNPIKASQHHIEEEVIELMRLGKKIQAIKIYREITGLGLKDAKEAVEGIYERSGLAW